jgi:hypothetical protein
MPQRAFDHVLLTRFSAVLAPGAEPAGEDWLRYRLAFFDQGTYASVVSQTTRDFQWLVLFDDRCSPEFRADIEYLAEDVFTPIWTHDDFRRDSFARHVVAATDEGPGPAPYLLTTRIDSDDAMAVDFMETVQAQFERQDRLFVSLTRGVQMDRSGAVYLSDQLSNPFITLIERREPARLPDTVYVAKHARARAHGPIREVRAPVMWLQVVHDLNLSNIVNGPRVAPAVVDERFRIDLTYDAGIGGAALLGARARQAGRLAKLWSVHPGELTKAAEAWGWRLRGTHERPQDDGATLTDRVQDLQQAMTDRWQRSALPSKIDGAKHRARVAKWRVQRRLNESLSSRVVPVAGDVDAVLAADRVVVMAEHGQGRQVREEALAGAAAWAAAGVPTLVVAARDAWIRSVVPPSVPDGVAVVQRPNVGYDFGSWGAGLASYPAIAGKRLVILTNDSLAGPFGPLDDVLARIEASTADVWAATEMLQPYWHLNSYLLAFRNGVLSRPPLRDVFAGVRPQESKRAVIVTYEIGLSNLVRQEGISYAVGWDHEALGLDRAGHPIVEGWNLLLSAGFPFVKRFLLEDRRFSSMRDLIALSVRQRYGVEI